MELTRDTWCVYLSGWHDEDDWNEVPANSPRDAASYFIEYEFFDKDDWPPGEVELIVWKDGEEENKYKVTTTYWKKVEWYVDVKKVEAA